MQIHWLLPQAPPSMALHHQCLKETWEIASFIQCNILYFEAATPLLKEKKKKEQRAGQIYTIGLCKLQRPHKACAVSQYLSLKLSNIR